MNESSTQNVNADLDTADDNAAGHPLAWHKRRFLGIAAAACIGFALLLAAAWWLISGDKVSVTAVTPPPSSSQKFAELSKELQKSQAAEVRIADFEIDDAMLQKLASIDRLTTIQVNINSISPATATKLAAMPALEQLHLRGSVINDEILLPLAKSPTIGLLNLSNTDVSPEAIENLGAMPALRQLRLGIQTGDNRHGRAVSTLSRLRSVHLIGVYVTDEVLQMLAKMPQLESLYLDDTAVTEAGWTWLFLNSPHLHVHIDQKHHDRDPHIH